MRKIIFALFLVMLLNIALAAQGTDKTATVEENRFNAMMSRLDFPGYVIERDKIFFTKLIDSVGNRAIYSLMNLPENYEKNEEFLLEISKYAKANTGDAFQNLPKDYESSKGFLLELAKKSADWEKGYMKIADVFKRLPANYSQNSEFLLKIADLSGRNTDYAFWRMHRDYAEHKDFLLKIATQEGENTDSVFRVLPPNYGETENFLLKIAETSERNTKDAFENMPEGYEDNEEFLMGISKTAKGKTGIAFALMLKDYGMDTKFSGKIALALKDDPDAAGYAPYAKYVSVKDYEKPEETKAETVKNDMLSLLKFEKETVNEAQNNPSSGSFRKLSEGILKTEKKASSQRMRIYMNYVHLNSIGAVFNRLHNDNTARTALANALEPELIYPLISESSELYTSSFRSLFDTMAYKLGGGKETLQFDENRRTEAQKRAIEAGAKKIIALAKAIDPDDYSLPDLLGRAGNLGKIKYIVPAEKTERKEFIGKIAEFAGIGAETVFSLFPLFKSKTALSKEDRKMLEDALIAEYSKADEENGKPFLMALIPFKDSLLKGDSERRKIAGKIPNLATPPEASKLVRETKEGKVLKALLYFAKDLGEPSEHFKIAQNYLKSQGYKPSETAEWKTDFAVMEKEIPYYKGGKLKVRVTLTYPEVFGLENAKDFSIVSHRGHSTEVRETFSDELYLKEPTLIFLGSCGGYDTFSELKETVKGNTAFLGTNGIGIGTANNELLVGIINGISKGKTWERLATELNTKIDFVEYAFPMDTGYRLLYK